jgi:hypothetical protein
MIYTWPEVRLPRCELPLYACGNCKPVSDSSNWQWIRTDQGVYVEQYKLMTPTYSFKFAQDQQAMKQVRRLPSAMSSP